MPWSVALRPGGAKNPRSPRHMGGCQNYGPFLGTYYTLKLKTTHMKSRSVVQILQDLCFPPMQCDVQQCNWCLAAWQVKTRRVDCKNCDGTGACSAGRGNKARRALMPATAAIYRLCFQLLTEILKMDIARMSCWW